MLIGMGLPLNLDQIKSARAIIARRALWLELVEMADEDPQSLAFRDALKLRLKSALDQGRAEIRRRFETDEADAAAVIRANAYLMDQVLRLLFDAASLIVYRAPNPSAAERLALVAVGGYGRAELFPHSDVDILFLRPYKATPWGEQVVEWMLYILWDLGLKVGHAVRSLDETLRDAAADVTIRTSLLDARWIWGDQALYGEFQRRFLQSIIAKKTAPAFIAAKLAERDARHQKLGDSRYVVEPNIKEGKGGLRDLHTLMWIGKALYGGDGFEPLLEKDLITREDARRFLKARSFLWTVRCHLHFISRRPEERLIFDAQLEIARRMGFTARPGLGPSERFMKLYYRAAKDVGDLTRILCAAIEAQGRKSLPVLGGLGSRARLGRAYADYRVLSGRLAIKDPQLFLKKPRAMIELFALAQEKGLDIHPDVLRALRQALPRIDGPLRRDGEANALFLKILTSRNDPETALRRMNEAGALGRFVPDFGRVVAQLQHDMYHHYTVDEHTVRAIGILARIEEGKLATEHPLATRIITQIGSRRALYVALFLHDIAKGRGGDHSELGAAVAEKLGPRFGLSASETETAAWLVRWHLLFSDTAFRRDVSDPKTVRDFAAKVQSLERLRLLLILTVADIRAVGPGVWNGWKGELLRALYGRAEEELSGGHVAEARAQRVASRKAEVTDLLLTQGWTQADAAQFCRRTYDPYWLTNSAEAISRHAAIIRDADGRNAPLTLATRSDPFRAVTEVTLYAADHPGLFARIAGAIAAAGGSVVDAQIATTADGMALDAFYIQDALGGAFDRPDKLARLSAMIEKALSGEVKLRSAIPREKPIHQPRARGLPVAPQVQIDNQASDHFTVIEVSGQDRPGFLHDVTRALTTLNLTIGSAHVTTYGQRAVDVFYVKDLTGMKVTAPARLAAIEKRLMEALAPAA